MPQQVTLTNSSVDILNVIRNNASQNYRDYIPQATAGGESIREVGGVIMDNPQLQNEFLSALVNRIGRVLITSKMFDNPLSIFKKGMMEFGETVEEIFVNIAKPFQYDANGAESTVFKRENPDVRAGFHILNYKKFYKSTIEQENLRQAFLSWQGITDLIAKIVDSMYTGANYDEFQTTKYMLAKHILKGRMFPVTIPTVEVNNMKDIVSTIKGVSNSLEFMSNKYNITGVKTFTNKDDQFLLVDSKFDAIMDVEVLASAFNMDKAQFMGHRVLVDSFGSLDVERLDVLFADDPTYTTFTEAQLTALNSIPAVLVDRDWFMIFDNLFNFTEQYNGQGLYWNYWYHVWKTFSISPFANNALFIPGTPAVTSVTVSPATVSAGIGQRVQLSAVTVTENFAPQVIDWSSPNEKVLVSPSGMITILEGATGNVTITATSRHNTAKKGTCIVTVV